MVIVVAHFIDLNAGGVSGIVWQLLKFIEFGVYATPLRVTLKQAPREQIDVVSGAEKAKPLSNCVPFRSRLIFQSSTPARLRIGRTNTCSTSISRRSDWYKQTTRTHSEKKFRQNLAMTDHLRNQGHSDPSHRRLGA